MSARRGAGRGRAGRGPLATGAGGDASVSDPSRAALVAPSARMSRNRGGLPLRAVGLLSALVLVLAGCTAHGTDSQSGTAGMSGQGSQSGVESSSQTPSAPASPRPSSTPVAAAEGEGDTATVEKAGGEPQVEEVGLDEAAVVMGDGSAGVSVSIPGITSTTAQASGPGEVSGPALVVTVSVENTMPEPVDLSLVAVNMTDSAGSPGEGMIGEPAQWLEGTLEPGGSAEGTYVFAIDRDARAPITVTVSLGASITTAQFIGDAD